MLSRAQPCAGKVPRACGDDATRDAAAQGAAGASRIDVGWAELCPARAVLSGVEGTSRWTGGLYRPGNAATEGRFLPAFELASALSLRGSAPSSVPSPAPRSRAQLSTTNPAPHLPPSAERVFITAGSATGSWRDAGDREFHRQPLRLIQHLRSTTSGSTFGWTTDGAPCRRDILACAALAL